MLSSDIRQFLKRVLPVVVTRLLSHGETYLRRLSACGRVARQIRGRSAKDRLVLWRSIAYSPFEMFDQIDRYREPTLDSDAAVMAKGLGLFHVRGRSDDLAHVVPANNTALFAAIQRQVRHADTVVDAGANIGAVTIYLANRVGAAGRVFAIEMIPETAACLRGNIELNQLHNVTLVQKALSDRPDEIILASFEAGFFGQASIAIGDRGGRANRNIHVRSTTLDDVLAGVEDIALLKLDLEGAESKALRGATETINRVRSVIFESWASDGGEAMLFLRKLGFQVTQIDGRNFLACRPARDPRA